MLLSRGAGWGRGGIYESSCLKPAFVREPASRHMHSQVYACKHKTVDNAEGALKRQSLKVVAIYYFQIPDHSKCLVWASFRALCPYSVQ